MTGTAADTARSTSPTSTPPTAALLPSATSVTSTRLSSSSSTQPSGRAVSTTTKSLSPAHSGVSKMAVGSSSSPPLLGSCTVTEEPASTFSAWIDSARPISHLLHPTAAKI
jgi:hypothetical protein